MMNPMRRPLNRILKYLAQAPIAGRIPRFSLPRFSLPLFSLLLLGLSSGSVRADVARVHPSLTWREAPHPSAPLARVFDVHQPTVLALKLVCEAPGQADEVHVLEPRPARELRVALFGLKASTEYRCRLEAKASGRILGAPLRFRTAALPQQLRAPRITVSTVDPQQAGYTLYNYGTMKSPEHYPANYLVILDGAGAIRWYREGAGGGGIDVSFLGQDRLLFAGDAGYADRKKSYLPPTIVGLDQQVQFMAAALPSSEAEEPGAYNHDAGLSPSGDSIFTLSYTEEHDEQGFDWTGFVIKEIELSTGALRWTWDSGADGAGVLPPPTRDNNNPYHANAVFERVENGRLYLYVSLKFLHQVIKIDYLTREVVWTLGVGGDFTLLEADGSPAEDARWFFSQHDVKRVGSSLTLHDNGLERSLYGQPDHSRALRLELDEQARTARIAFEFTEPGWNEPNWGGFDWLPDGNGLIAMGHYWPFVEGDAREHFSALVEVDGAGKVVWRAEFLTRYDVLYRAERIDGCALFALESACMKP